MTSAFGRQFSAPQQMLVPGKQANEFLTFTPGDEEYGVEILKVREQIRPAPESGAGLDTRYIIGLGTVDDRMLILMDIERFITGQDMALVDVSMHLWLRGVKHRLNLGGNHELETCRDEGCNPTWSGFWFDDDSFGGNCRDGSKGAWLAQ
jgi:hypothetical protein